MMSCISVKDINEGAPLYQAQESFTINDLKGDFLNKPDKLDQNSGQPLGKFLFAPFLTYHCGDYIDLQGRIRIKPLGTKSIQVQLWKSDTLCCETVLKGRLKANYFEVDRHLRLRGVPLLYFKSQERKIILSVDESGNLILKQGSYGIGNVFLFSGGSQDYTSFVYKRVV
jgi:hypothetical protein